MRIKIFIIFLILLLPAQGLAQLFKVSPTKYITTIVPGQTSDQALLIANLNMEEENTFEISLVSITQKETGAFSVANTKDNPSKVSWILLDKNSVKIKPQETEEIHFKIKTPNDAYGINYAGFLVAKKEIERQKRGNVDVKLKIQFLVPIIMEVKGRKGRTKIEVLESGLFNLVGKDSSNRTIAFINIKNTGITYPRLDCVFTLFKKVDTRLIKLMTKEKSTREILPGANFKLDIDIEKPLPPGDYLLEYTLNEGNKGVLKAKNNIKFVGTPGLEKQFASADFSINISKLEIESYPGGSARGAIQLQNNSDQVILVAPSFNHNGIEGLLEQYKAGEWLKASPSPARIMGARSTSLRIIGRLPKDIDQANYYSSLELKGKYLSGESAGDITVPVVINNKNVETHFEAELDQANVELKNGSKHLVSVSANLINKGTGHFDPVYEASLETLMGSKISSSKLSSDKKFLMPNQSTKLNGDIDISEVIPGDYKLIINGNCGPDCRKEKLIPLRVSGGNEKKVEIISKE